jgi:thiamine-phosphate pyrophosphorylase
LEQLRGAIAGGVDVVQVREPDLEARTYVALVREAIALTQGTKCKVLVNDRLDVAVATGAHGVHLREAGLPIEVARRAAPLNFTVGRSVHSPEAAAASREADYMIAGSVFDTESKPGQTLTLGLDGLLKLVTAAGQCPVWAVGGVTVERLADVRRCGASGVAAIGAFLPSHGTQDIQGQVLELTNTFRRALDRMAELP